RVEFQKKTGLPPYGNPAQKLSEVDYADRAGAITALSIRRTLPTRAAIATTIGRSTTPTGSRLSASTASTHSILTPGSRSHTAVATPATSAAVFVPVARALRAAASARLSDSAVSRSLPSR